MKAATADQKPEGTDIMPKKPGLRPKKANLKPERAGLRSRRTDNISERADLFYFLFYSIMDKITSSIGQAISLTAYLSRLLELSEN